MVEKTIIMRAYRCRVLPTEEQEANLKQWYAAVRAVYNAALEKRELFNKINAVSQHLED
jgi:transposase